MRAVRTIYTKSIIKMLYILNILNIKSKNIVIDENVYLVCHSLNLHLGFDATGVAK